LEPAVARRKFLGFLLAKRTPFWHTSPVSTTTEERKSERLVARISPEDKAIVERAAELEGRSLASFVVAHLREHSQSVIEKHSHIHLNRDESHRFVRALQSAPRPPTPSMLRAVREHRESVIEH
jgi:uncharacterized protein (DUF1778 family)